MQLPVQVLGQGLTIMEQYEFAQVPVHLGQVLKTMKQQCTVDEAAGEFGERSVTDGKVQEVGQVPTILSSMSLCRCRSARPRFQIS